MLRKYLWYKLVEAQVREGFALWQPRSHRHREIDDEAATRTQPPRAADVDTDIDIDTDTHTATISRLLRVRGCLSVCVRACVRGPASSPVSATNTNTNTNTPPHRCVSRAAAPPPLRSSPPPPPSPPPRTSTMGDKNSWVSQDRLAKYKEGLKSSTSTTPQPAASPPAAASAQAQKPRRVFHERYFERYSTTLGDWESIEDPMPAVPLSSIQSIKCVSYNVWFVDRFFDERREALCNILRDERPDVICLQEITERFLQYIISLQWVQDEYLISDTRGTTGTRECLRASMSFQAAVVTLSYSLARLASFDWLSIIA